MELEHIFPQDDIEVHTPDEKCPCHPRLVGTSPAVFHHNPFDGRTLKTKVVLSRN